MKKDFILFTDSYYFSDSTSSYNNQIARSLSKSNNVKVICLKPLFSNYPSYERPNKNLKVIRLIIPFSNSRIFPLKVVKFICFSLSASLYLFFKKKSREVLLICTSPPVILPPLIFLSRLKDILSRKYSKKILLAQDIYPDILENNLYSRSIGYHLLRILNFIYLKTYFNFDFAISCCEPIKNKLVKKYNMSDSKVKVINNWTLIDAKIVKTHIPINLDINKKLEMFLIGNVGKLHLHKQTSETLKNILLKSNLIKSLHMYTRGAHHKDIFNHLCFLNNVYLHELIPSNDLAKVYSQPSITIVPLSQVASQCAFPSRIATAVSLGSPVLVITDILENNYLADFVNKYKIGLVLTKTDQLNNEDWITNDFKSNFNYYQQNCLKLYEKFFTLNKNIEDIKNTIESI